MPDRLQPRGRMRIALSTVVPPFVAGLRNPRPVDEDALASLMMRAYAGTIDYEGESEAEALAEVRRTLSGSLGPFLWSESNVIEREGTLACATLVIRWNGEPLVAFAMTDARFKRQGLARACMLSSMHQLRALGERRLSLFVTLANAEAVSLYRSLGFSFRQ
jgi:GNAT superfamily N-acetyltransferase